MLDVDVVLPTRRGERWVAEAVHSVIRQTHTRWHLFAVDDASSDGTAERVEELRRLDPGRISLLRLQRRSGSAGARMEVLARARGELVAFIDQDDRWRSDKLARQVAMLAERRDVGAVHTDIEIIDAEGALVPGAADAENRARGEIDWDAGDPQALWRTLFLDNRIRLVSSVVRRSAFDAVGGFDIELFGGEDWQFWVRLARRYGIAHLPEPLVERRQHDGNTSDVYFYQRCLGQLEALRRLELSREAPASLVPQRRRRLLRAARDRAWRERRLVRAVRHAAALLLPAPRMPA